MTPEEAARYREIARAIDAEYRTPAGISRLKAQLRKVEARMSAAKLQALLSYLASDDYLDGLNESVLRNLTAEWANAGAIGLRQDGKTIRVRIAVAQRGTRWSACGYNAEDGKVAKEGAADTAWLGLDDVESGSECLHWVEAYVPSPPEPKAVEGVVVP
jgi:hypothetical protein